MPNLNSVMLMGNLTREPEVKYTPKGTAVCQFGLAINRTWKNDAGQKQEETTFVDVELWGRTAEIAAEYLKKGSPAFIEGRLKLDSWDDKATGQKRSKLKVVGEALQLLASREAQGSEQGQRRTQGNKTPPAAPQARQRPPIDPDLDVPDSEIPF